MKYEQFKKQPDNGELEEKIKKLGKWKSIERRLKRDLRISEERFDVREVFPKTVNSIRLERLEEVKINKEFFFFF